MIKRYLIVLIISMAMLGTIGLGSVAAGEPPPEGSKPSGKGTAAILSANLFYVGGYPLVLTTVVGECSGLAFQLGPFVNVYFTQEIFPA